MRNDNYRRYTQAEAVPTRKVLQHPTKLDLFFPVHGRPQRLPNVDYASADCLCFITFNVNAAAEALLTGENGPIAWVALNEQLTQIGCTVHACCMMPDHVHILLAPSGAGETVSDIVRRVKSYICLALRREKQAYLKWQPSFFDHVLRDRERTEDEIQTIVAYIRLNPAKAGLGDTYPFIV